MARDALVVGLGTAGAAAALALARSGARVTGIDASPLEATGARWVNGVPGWAFAEAGIEAPVAPELRAGPAPFHLSAGWGGPRITVRSVWEVDMRAFTRRLLDQARAAGATLLGGERVREVSEGELRTDHGTHRFHLVVDCTGVAGLGLLGASPTPREDLCVAAQQVHHVRDLAGARAWLAAHRARDGEVVCASGVAGGYSIVNVRVEGQQVGILTGSIPALGHPPGSRLLREFLASNPWVGEKVFGGSRSIPLRRPLEVVGWGRVVALGDSASMVYAPHGSGIAQQLLAARLLGEIVARGGTPWDFNVAWQRRFGGLLASADLLRRATTPLTTAEMARMVNRRILSPELSADVMDQRPARPPMRALARAALGMAREPRMARQLLPPLVLGRAVERHYRRYPDEPSGLATWLRRLERLTGLPGSTLTLHPGPARLAAPSEVT